MITSHKIKQLLWFLVFSLIGFQVNQAWATVVFIVGPSGVGKSTVVQNLVKTSAGEFQKIVSHTTRAPRKHEEDGKDYYFISQADFAKKDQNSEFIVTSNEYGQCYGLAYQEIKKASDASKIFIKEIGVDIIKPLKEKLGKQGIFIFLAPPSYEILQSRLRQRSLASGESDKELEKRLQNAIDILPYEVQCDYVIVANNINETTHHIRTILAERQGQIGKMDDVQLYLNRLAVS